MRTTSTYVKRYDVKILIIYAAFKSKYRKKADLKTQLMFVSLSYAIRKVTLMLKLTAQDWLC